MLGVIFIREVVVGAGGVGLLEADGTDDCDGTEDATFWLVISGIDGSFSAPSACGSGSPSACDVG